MKYNWINGIYVAGVVKLSCLFYISVTAQLTLATQLIVIPLLILEALALVGYVYESTQTARVKNVKIAAVYSEERRFTGDRRKLRRAA